MRIEDWSLIIVAQEKTRSLHGYIFGHPKFNNGKLITTSPIVGKNDQDEVVTNSGNSYELGQVSQDYEARFPGARKILLDSLGMMPCV